MDTPDGRITNDSRHYNELNGVVRGIICAPVRGSWKCCRRLEPTTAHEDLGIETCGAAVVDFCSSMEDLVRLRVCLINSTQYLIIVHDFYTSARAAVS